MSVNQKFIVRRNPHPVHLYYKTNHKLIFYYLISISLNNKILFSKLPPLARFHNIPYCPNHFAILKQSCNGHVCIDLIAPNAPWIKFSLNMAHNEVFWWFNSRIVLYICINQLCYHRFNKREFMANYAGGIIKLSLKRRYVNETIKKRKWHKSMSWMTHFSRIWESVETWRLY